MFLGLSQNDSSKPKSPQSRNAVEIITRTSHHQQTNLDLLKKPRKRIFRKRLRIVRPKA